MNCHFHIIYMDLVDLLEESWMEWDSLKTWIGALQTCKQKPLLWWLLCINETENCKRILSIIKLLSDCVNTTDKNKPYWNNIWIYGAFYMEKNIPFAKVILPPYWISLCCQRMSYFSISAMLSSTSSATEVFETGPFPLLSQRGRLSKQSAY